eukprot:CAMPEP_0204308036 /NCGR_PEP_ID=MMETSP0469-20131031/267_1 /ASSEMBLY_ACC=CAM_ASM_000384 /TAXON_ID=2969 /ORGANISM="Oxyrrhis marina" /LENGTH=166 /DNA_ID=CAMNT_0051287455 /DNA_START=142 /DNA_END=638 /DNA_ORIENTATION=-
MLKTVTLVLLAVSAVETGKKRRIRVDVDPEEHQPAASIRKAAEHQTWEVSNNGVAAPAMDDAVSADSLQLAQDTQVAEGKQEPAAAEASAPLVPLPVASAPAQPAAVPAEPAAVAQPAPAAAAAQAAPAVGATPVAQPVPVDPAQLAGQPVAAAVPAQPVPTAAVV